VVAVAAGLVAVVQRNRAVEQARIALCGQLAAVSTTRRSTALDTAALFAVQSFATHPDPRSRAALLGASTTAG
jgi:hypothetical protein